MAKEYMNLRFLYSHTGFLKNLYKCKETNRYYCLQWDEGYTKPPKFYSATKDGEADSPVRKDYYEYFIFPEGHEHYQCILREFINN
jgi:hypothetical protein